MDNSSGMQGAAAPAASTNETHSPDSAGRGFGESIDGPGARSGTGIPRAPVVLLIAALT